MLYQMSHPAHSQCSDKVIIKQKFLSQNRESNPTIKSTCKGVSQKKQHVVAPEKLMMKIEAKLL
jgi:hypothetical protein